MFESTGRECARHRSLDLIVATRVVGAAEVIDVVPPLGAEMVGHSFCRTTGRTIAAPRKGAVVIDDHPAAGCTEAALPAVIEPVFEAPAHVQRFDTHWIGPVLIAQQFARRGIVGQRCAAQQLITGHRALLFVLILDVQLQQGPLADVPVERQRCKVALTVGMLDIGANVFVRQVGAQTELLLAAKPAADVGGDVAFTVLVGGHRDRPDVLRAFGLIVDDAARLGNAALQARQALEQLDLLLVLQRHVLLAGDAAAIDAIAVGRVQREAAHHKVFVIAYRRITVAHRGIVAQHVTQQLCLTVLDQRFAEHRHRSGCVEQQSLIEPINRCTASSIVAGAFLLAKPGYVDRIQIERLCGQQRRGNRHPQGQ